LDKRGAQLNSTRLAAGDSPLGSIIGLAAIFAALSSSASTSSGKVDVAMADPLAKHFLLRARLLREQVPSFDDYPFSLPAFRGLDTIVFHPAVTFLIGENGTGKSTLLEAIAVGWGLNPEGGSRNFNFSTRASHSSLHRLLRLAKGVHRPRDSYFLRAESFFNVATEIERLDSEPGGGARIIGAYGGRSLHEMSHGESFLALVTHRFRGSGLYILDEPEAALSPIRQMALLVRIHQLVSEGAQFIIATHSPLLMAYPGAIILLLEEKADIRSIAYEETEHFRVTRDFLRDPAKSLAILFDAHAEEES
jgi:predicted ATPase